VSPQARQEFWSVALHSREFTISCATGPDHRSLIEGVDEAFEGRFPRPQTEKGSAKAGQNWPELGWNDSGPA
jgi:hypothetical protein